MTATFSILVLCLSVFAGAVDQRPPCRESVSSALGTSDYLLYGLTATCELFFARNIPEHADLSGHLGPTAAVPTGTQRQLECSNAFLIPLKEKNDGTLKLILFNVISRTRTSHPLDDIAVRHTQIYALDFQWPKDGTWLTKFPIPECTVEANCTSSEDSNFWVPPRNFFVDGDTLTSLLMEGNILGRQFVLLDNGTIAANQSLFAEAMLWQYGNDSVLPDVTAVFGDPVSAEIYMSNDAGHMVKHAVAGARDSPNFFAMNSEGWTHFCTWKMRNNSLLNPGSRQHPYFTSIASGKMIKHFRYYNVNETIDENGEVEVLAVFGETAEIVIVPVSAAKADSVGEDEKCIMEMVRPTDSGRRGNPEDFKMLVLLGDYYKMVAEGK